MHLGGDFLAKRRPVTARLPGVEPEQAELVVAGFQPPGHHAPEPGDGIRDGLRFTEHLIPLGRRRMGEGGRDELVRAEVVIHQAGADTERHGDPLGRDLIQAVVHGDRGGRFDHLGAPLLGSLAAGRRLES